MYCLAAPFSGKRNEFRSTQQATAARNVRSTTKQSRICAACCLRSRKNRTISPKGVAAAFKKRTSTVWTKNFNHAFAGNVWQQADRQAMCGRPTVNLQGDRPGAATHPPTYFPAIRCAGNKLNCLLRTADRYGILFFDNLLSTLSQTNARAPGRAASANCPGQDITPPSTGIGVIIRYRLSSLTRRWETEDAGFPGLKQPPVWPVRCDFVLDSCPPSVFHMRYTLRTGNLVFSAVYWV